MIKQSHYRTPRTLADGVFISSDDPISTFRGRKVSMWKTFLNLFFGGSRHGKIYLDS